MDDNLRRMGLDKTRARKGAVRPKVTGEDVRRMLADVATGVGVPFIDAASQAAQGNYGQAAISGLLDAPPVKMAGMALAPLIGMVRKAAPMDEALRIAQKNAAKPVSEGGLGLPPNNTPMDRARAMGFEDMYHGTRSDIKKIDSRFFGEATKAKSAEQAFFGAAEPITAGSYAINLPDAYFKKAAKKAEDYFNKSRAPLNEKVMSLRSKVQDAERLKPAFGSKEYENWKQSNSALFDELKTYQDVLNSDWEVFFNKNISPMRDKAWDEGSNIIPLMVRSEDFVQRDFPQGFRDRSYFDIISDAKKSGASGVKLTNTQDAVGLGEDAPVTTIFATLNPSRIRSRFAAFDPARINENNLLASLAALGISVPVMRGLLQEEEMQ